MSIIKSKRHYEVKKRIFDRLFNQLLRIYKDYNKIDNALIKDCWNLSNELLKHAYSNIIFNNEFERENLLYNLIQKRRLLLDLMGADTKFELGLYI